MIGIVLLALVAVPRPTAAGVPPRRFAQATADDRESWRLDQVQIASNTRAGTLAAFEPDHSMDAVIARLKRLAIPFTRTTLTIRPDGLPPALRTALDKLPPGEPFVLRERDYVSISVIVGRHLPANMTLLRPLSPTSGPEA